MNKNPKEENMDILICLVIPIACAVFTYIQKRYEGKKEKENYEMFVKRFADDVKKQLSLPPKS